MRRRTILTSIPSVLITGAVSGCTDLAPLDDDPDENLCAIRDGRYNFVDVVPDDNAVFDHIEGLSLTVTPIEGDAGQQRTAVLKNTAETKRAIYGADRIMVQKLNSEGEWFNTIGVHEDHEWTTEPIDLLPGEELQWEFGNQWDDFPDPYASCTTHHGGTYRFLYWGFSSIQSPHADNEPQLAVSAPFIIRHVETMSPTD